MKKYIALISISMVIATLVLLAWGLPVSAWDTSNATSQYIFTDNFTVSFAGPLEFQIDVTDLTTGMTTAAEAGAQVIANEIEDAESLIISYFIFAVLLLAIMSIAYRFNDRPLMAVSGLGMMIYGFSFNTYSIWYSIALVVMGFVVCLRSIRGRGAE